MCTVPLCRQRKRLRTEDSAPELLSLLPAADASLSTEISVAADAPAPAAAPSAAPTPPLDLVSCSIEQLMAEVARRQSQQQQPAEAEAERAEVVSV